MAPAQNLVPVLTQELADAGGATLADTLNAVSELLTTEELTTLNLLIAEQRVYEDIAAQWLTDNGAELASASHAATRRVGRFAGPPVRRA